MPYHMKPFDLGILVEFYIPKKVSYQGPLHKHLRDALYIDNVRKLLREHQDKILPTLDLLLSRRGYGQDDWEQLIDKIPDDIFGGWSMYEVDGVFIDRDKEQSIGKQQQSNVYEERTQVVRIILYPDLKKIQSTVGGGYSLDTVRGLTDAFMVHPIARSAHFLADHGTFWLEKFQNNNYALEQACQCIEEWITSAGLFMFGYLVWAVSNAIGTEEKVFWVTSTWSVNINQVELDNQGGSSI